MDILHRLTGCAVATGSYWILALRRQQQTDHEVEQRAHSHRTQGKGGPDQADEVGGRIGQGAEAVGPLAPEPAGGRPPDCTTPATRSARFMTASYLTGQHLLQVRERTGTVTP